MSCTTTRASGNAPRRRPQTSCCEIVRVAAASFLINSRHQACRYETREGIPLAPGYYLALRPAGAPPAVYGAEVRFLGPYATQSVAVLLQTSAYGLGIVEPGATGAAAAPAAALAAQHWRALSLAAGMAPELLDEQAAYQGA